MFFLTRAPRTQRELAELIGCKIDTVAHVIEHLTDEGLVRLGPKRKTPAKSGHGGRTANTYEWIPLDP